MPLPLRPITCAALAVSATGLGLHDKAAVHTASQPCSWSGSGNIMSSSLTRASHEGWTSMFGHPSLCLFHPKRRLKAVSLRAHFEYAAFCHIAGITLMILSHTVWSNVECLLVKSRGVSREGWASMLGHPYFTLSLFPPSSPAFGDIFHLRPIHLGYTPTVAWYCILLLSDDHLQ